MSWDGTPVGDRGGTGGGATGPVAFDLPCEVAQVLTASCADCHGPSASQGLVRLASRADLLATSPIDASHTEAQRALIRMQDRQGAMPPQPRAAVSAAAIATFQAWVNSGMGAGTCAVGASDGGVAARDAGTSTWDGGLSGLPCDVAAMVGARCIACHGPLGPDLPLLSLADFLGPAPSNPALTVAASAELRLHSTSPGRMPPPGYPVPTSAEVAAFDAWVAAGTPVGTCGSVDTGVTDGGHWPTTCTSGTFWAGGNQESADMNPGRPCLACHRTEEASKRYPFSGTVYPSLHEQDFCDGPTSSGTVEIYGADGGLALTLLVSPVSGNFNSRVDAGVTRPYTARVWRNGRYTEMTTPQMDGDCNGCHSEQGAGGARGRIVWP